MILSGKQIRRELGKNIIIDPFEPSQVGPNSYNLRLSTDLLVYDEPALDMRRVHKTRALTIPPEGLVLKKGTLYLGRTLEYTKTSRYVPMLEGRSSIGRLGLFIHVTAGFGDVGFAGYWTLEMYCIMPIRIYAGVQIGQIFYHTIYGEHENYGEHLQGKGGKYQDNHGIQASMLYKDFE